MLRYFFLTFYILLCITFARGQSGNIDALVKRKNELGKTAFFEKDTAYINTLNELAFAIAFSDLEEMQVLANEAQRLSESIKYTKGILQAKNNLADYYMFSGNLEQSLNQHNENIAQAKAWKADFIMLQGLNSKAYILNQISDYSQSFKVLNESLEITERLDNKVYQVKTYMNLGNLMAVIGNTEEALEYYMRCLELKPIEPISKAEVLINLGYTYLTIGHLDKASVKIFEAIEIFETHQVLEWLAYAYQLASDNYVKQGNTRKALEYLNKSDSIHQKIEDPVGFIDLRLTEATLLFFEKEMEKSKTVALQAHKLAEDRNYFDGQIISSELLSKIFNEQKEYQKAFSYLVSGRKLSDSVQKENNKSKLEILKIKSDLETQKLVKISNYKEKLSWQRVVIIITLGLISLLVITLISRRKIAIKQTKLNNELRKSNELKTKIFSIIGHDLKAPIGTLQQLLELYQNKAITTAEIVSLAPRLKDNVDHSAFMLNNLLLWAQNQMNGVTVMAQEIDVVQISTEVLELYKEHITNKNISIEYLGAKELIVFFDVEHMKIILRNIIFNAIKYTKENGVLRFNSSETKNEIVFSICDNGIGMEADMIERLLSNENLVSSPGTQNEKGTGLGINICKDLLTANNSTLKIDSELGKGSCFHIHLSK